MSSLNLAWKFDVSIDWEPNTKALKNQTSYVAETEKRPRHAPIEFYVTWNTFNLFKNKQV